VLENVQAWGRRHQRVLVIGLSGVAGVYLTIKGVLGLLV
jgi:hypothetical protein